MHELLVTFTTWRWGIHSEMRRWGINRALKFNARSRGSRPPHTALQMPSGSIFPHGLADSFRVATRARPSASPSDLSKPFLLI